MHFTARIAVRWTALALASIALVWSGSLAAGRLTNATTVQAAEPKPIQLPKPQTTGGMPLMQALSARKTTRAFQDKPLPLQTLSNLLWAAFGVNRSSMESHMPGGKPQPGRTAPSAMNRQEIELYVVLADGIYVYDAVQNQLRPVAAGDMRSKIGAPPAEHAAVTIVYVGPANNSFEQVDTGFIGQNVYLFAASEGLNAWLYAMHGPQETAAVAATLNLGADRVPLYGQSVGYPPQ
ncbi:MAG: SagB/ThcOx family dehydrogenase [Terracidiphilus sp.]